MKQFLKISFLFLAFFTLSMGAQAQKYGFVNTDLILATMPDVKTMEPQLQTLQTQLQKKGQQMVTNLQKASQTAQADLEAGKMSPVQQEAKQKELAKMQEEILAYEQSMQQQLMQKREQLLGPILEKVNNAINAVAKEQGYTMLFNGSPSSGVLLYADEAQDATAAVKSKLGI